MVDHSTTRPSTDTSQPRHLKLFALASPPLLAGFHVVLYVVHRATAGTAPAEVPGELISLVVFLLGFHIILYRRGASLGLQAAALLVSLLSLLAAPVAGFVLVVLISAR